MAERTETLPSEEKSPAGSRCGVGHTSYLTRTRLARYRYAIMLLAVVVFLPPLSLVIQVTGDSNFCGTWCPRMFYLWRWGESWNAYWLGYFRAFMGVALVVGILMTTFFFGRHWCSHFCPIGAVTELGSKLVPRRLKIDYRGLPAPAFRYGYLTVYLLAPALGIGSLCCGYCNFATVPRLLAAPFSTADALFFWRTAGGISLVLVIVLGFLAKGGRAYCNLLCPVGAIDSLINALGAMLGRRRIRVTSSQCIDCGECVHVCPLWAIKPKNGTATIDPFSCMPCRLCETTCPTGAIRYGKTSA